MTEEEKREGLEKIKKTLLVLRDGTQEERTEMVQAITNSSPLDLFSMIEFLACDVLDLVDRVKPVIIDWQSFPMASEDGQDDSSKRVIFFHGDIPMKKCFKCHGEFALNEKTYDGDNLMSIFKCPSCDGINYPCRPYVKSFQLAEIL